MSINIYCIVSYVSYDTFFITFGWYYMAVFAPMITIF